VTRELAPRLVIHGVGQHGEVSIPEGRDDVAPRRGRLATAPISDRLGPQDLGRDVDRIGPDPIDRERKRGRGKKGDGANIGNRRNRGSLGPRPARSSAARRPARIARPGTGQAGGKFRSPDYRLLGLAAPRSLLTLYRSLFTSRPRSATHGAGP
jgi:hypothetical protein